MAEPRIGQGPVAWSSVDLASLAVVGLEMNVCFDPRWFFCGESNRLAVPLRELHCGRYFLCYMCVEISNRHLRSPYKYLPVTYSAFGATGYHSVKHATPARDDCQPVDDQ